MHHLRPSSHLFSRLIGATLVFLQVTSAVAGSFRTTGNINGRSSLNFHGRSNIKTIIPEGTEGEVLERWKLPSGNYGIKIKVENVGDTLTSSKLKKGDEVWVYYHQDEKLRLVELYDDNHGKPVSNAEDGNWAVALKTFKVATAPVVENNSVCSDCNGQDTIQAVTQNLSNATQIIEAVKEIPEVDTSVEEIVTFINRYRYQPETNRRIAKAVIAEAKENGVSIAFILSVMAAESNYKVTAVSKGAGAMGLMQLMKPAWEEVMGKNSRRSFDIELNIRAGVRYLAKKLKDNNGDEMLALYSYKNGHGNTQEFLRGDQKKSKTTKDYQREIMQTKSNYLAYQAKTGEFLAKN